VVIMPTPASVSRESAHLARGAYYLLLLFLGLVLLLHVIEADISPKWRTVSEYALGDFGWVMNGAFVVMGIGALLLAAALWRRLDSRSPRVGAALVAVWGICSVFSAFFPTDSSMDIASQNTTQTGNIHSALGGIGILSLLTGATVTALALRRRAPSAGARAVAWTTLASWVGFVVAFGTAAQMGASGGPTPASWFGVGERLLLFTFWLWMVTTARQLVTDQNPSLSPTYAGRPLL
jgi:hypothetical membrane protein